MTTAQPSAAPNIVERAKNILLTPNAEFGKIANENTGLGALLMGYVLPLALIAVIARFIGGFMFGIGGFGFYVHPPLMTLLVSAVISFVFTFIGVYVFDSRIRGQHCHRSPDRLAYAGFVFGSCSVGSLQRKDRAI